MTDPCLPDLLHDPRVFKPSFRPVSDWQAWEVFLCALFGYQLESEEERSIFHRCTKLEKPRARGYDRAWMICGRRSGKTSMLALLAVFLATFRDYRAYLRPGEVATVMVVAADREQAKQVVNYAKGILAASPMLRAQIEGETADTIRLSKRRQITVKTCSLRSVRGYTLCAALLDEIAFWRNEESAANPDHEVIAALEPALETIPGSIMIAASSPYARKGELWNAFKNQFGKETDELVWRAPTRWMNKRVRESTIRRALAKDRSKAAAEWLAIFRSDLEAFVSVEQIEALVPNGIKERAPIDGIQYSAFVDPSGGGPDGFALAIGHREDGRAILDCLRERRRAKPSDVVKEYAAILRAYRITKVVGDKYAGRWPADEFSKHHIGYDAAPKSKSDLYVDCLPLLNSGGCELLDNPKLIAQFTSLERRTSRQGRDTIDHPPNAHDDLSNAVAGLFSQIGGGDSYSEALAKAIPLDDDTRSRHRKLLAEIGYRQ